jgi:Spy/CpxP family protein refolding chaperone
MEEQNEHIDGDEPESNDERYALKKSRKKFSITKKILISVVIVLLIVSAGAGISFAHKMKQLKDGGPLMFMLEKVTKDLNLTDAQKSQVQALKDEIKTKMESRKKDRQSGAEDFENAFKQDKLDKETLKSIEQKHESNREEMKDFMMDELIKFHDILTSDQRTQVVQKIEDMRKNHDMWKHHDKSDDNKQNN